MFNLKPLYLCITENVCLVVKKYLDNGHFFRAIVFSPTRELALQTLKFTRELGRYTGLRAACVLGGESMEKQFAVMHERPDVVRS